MTIRTRDQLDTLFAEGQFRTIISSNVRDFLDSLGVGGTMYGTDGSQGITTSWQVFTAYDGSIDTRGVNEDTGAGTFTIQAGADGFFSVVFACTLDIPGNGQIEFRFSKNGNATPFRTGAIDVDNGIPRQFIIVGNGSLVDGDVVAVQIRGSASATATVNSAQLQISRS